MTNIKHRRLALVASPIAALLITLVPLAAQAQRKSPLEDAPAIRKRVELRGDDRLDLAHRRLCRGRRRLARHARIHPRAGQRLVEALLEAGL